MIAVRIQSIVLVLDEANAVSENFEFGDSLLEPLCEFVALVVYRVPLPFGGADCRDGCAFRGQWLLNDFVKAVSVIPEVSGVGVDSIWVWKCLFVLTG